MDDEETIDHWPLWGARRRPQRRRNEEWSFRTENDDDMFDLRRLVHHHTHHTSRPHSRSSESNTAPTADAERLQVLDAVERAKALKLCLRRIWAVASSLPDRENSLPGLIPLPGTFLIPGHDRERHEHEQCTFDFCEQSRVDFTSVAQHHETPCEGQCEQVTFPLQLLNGRVKNRKPTAWRLNEPSLLDASRPYMAISHVWSDGTGSGIWGPGKVNKCLYTFFSKIAQSFQCEGCWWYSISIPLVDEIRTKALSSMHINYSNSRITLVHDLYLRQWDWVDSETACFSIVMSPWYSRGWTALELAQSHKVKILFKAKNKEYVIKDLDVDILAKVPDGHPTADAIRKLRRASIDEFGTLLAILGARDTSKPRDVPIISGLLAGVDISGGLSQQEIYQRILRKLGKVAQGHLFHNSATMSAPGFSWCPTNILDMPMAEPDSDMLTLHENGDLEGEWMVQVIDSVKVEDLVTRGIHPLTQVSLEAAFCGESMEKHVLLLETKESKPTSRDRRALLVRLMGSSDEIHAKFVGPVYFCAPRGSAEKEGAKTTPINIRIGSTEGLDDVPGKAWDYVQIKMKKSPTTEETSATSRGQSTTKSDIDAQEKLSQRTSLHYAAEKGDFGMVQRLLDYGADLDLRDSNLQAALHYAASKGKAEVVNLLLDHAKKLSSSSGSNESMETCNPPSESINSATRDKTNGTTGHDSGEEDGDENDVKVNGALTGVNGTSSDSITSPGPRKPGKPSYSNIRDSQEQTPLHLAAEAGHDEIVATLLTHGASLCAETKNKETALILAAKFGHTEIVQSLLQIGEGGFKQSELDRALLMAAVKNDKTVITRLHEHGARSNRCRDGEGMTALHWTIREGNEDSAKLLIQSQEEANIDILGENKARSALLMASEKGMKSVVALLLERGSNINQVDMEKCTALHLAARGPHPETVAVLLNEKYKCPMVSSQMSKTRMVKLHYY